MYHPSDITQVHLEITSRCNAACPMCARNILGAWTNPELPLDELSLDEIKIIFDPDFLYQLERIYLCGNYGDPMVAKDLIPVLEYFRSVNPDIGLGMHTNGSGRTAEWWTNIAQYFSQPDSSMTFSIDGLEDTNHLYRQRTQWDKIMTAASAFIAAGGNAQWDFLVFEHNQHQVEEARALATKMGFRSFQVKKTGRFTQRGKLGWDEAHPVYRPSGELSHFLRPATDQHNRNSLYTEDSAIGVFFPPSKPKPTTRSFTPFDSGVDFGEYGEYVRKTCIDCKAAGNREIFINFQGLVLPCCWISFPLHNWDNNGTNNQIKTTLHEYGLDRLSALKHPITDIVAGDLFQSDIPANWVEGQSIRDGKLMICAQHCGSRSHVRGENEIL